MIWSRRSVVKMRLKVVIACPGRIGNVSVETLLAQTGDEITP
jgi:hypothetical protein